MNIWTHQQILSSLQVRDDVNEKLDNIREFAKWRNEMIQSISDIVASGHVPPFAQEPFHPPSKFPTQESEFLMKSAETLVALIGEKRTRFC